MTVETYELKLTHFEKFQVVVTHPECGSVLGLVKGGLTKQPRLYCFECGEIINHDESRVEVKEIE